MPEDTVVDSGTTATTTAATPGQTAVATDTTSQNTATGQNSGNDAWAKEKRGIQADLQRERKARQDYERRVQQYESELNTERNRVRALSGVNPVNPGDAEKEEVRARFKELFPELGGLTAEDIAAMRASAQDAKGLKEATTSHWNRHNKGMVDKLGTIVAKEIGGTLTPRQTKHLVAAYVQTLQADDALAERHESGDETLLDEFAKQWAEDWVEPVRRQTTKQEQGRFRPVPNGQSRSIVTTGEKTLDYTNDEAVGDFISKGRTFGRR